MVCNCTPLLQRLQFKSRCFGRKERLKSRLLAKMAHIKLIELPDLRFSKKIFPTLNKIIFTDLNKIVPTLKQLIFAKWYILRNQKFSEIRVR